MRLDYEEEGEGQLRVLRFDRRQLTSILRKSMAIADTKMVTCSNALTSTAPAA